MENHLFNESLLKKYAAGFRLTPGKYDIIKEYMGKVDSGGFKGETKNYLYFYDVVLKALLGYKREDVLFDEKGDEGTGRSEFVLKDDDKKFMVIELKGQGIDLDKKQSGRADNKSPVEQAFGYAINTGDVDWIMVSNYEEFRLYNYYEKTNYISFSIRDLLDKKWYSYFMLAFSRASHIETGHIEKVREGTLIVDRKLAGEFYKLYHETRLMLIKELETQSDMERLEAIHCANLILNRYMFICFAEDTGLLPPQISVDTISTPILKGNIRHGSIWQRLNELFFDINEGNEFKKINEYNGGLFEKNLEDIRIRDLVDDQSIFDDAYQNWDFSTYEKDISHLLGTAKDRINPIFRNMLTISSFDFSTELDVNILGHIFENSIGDIEELKADTKGRRKKEGIFYTPDYITDYICRNTIIPYLSKNGNTNTVTELIGEYWGSDIEELDQKVKAIKIVDPACGSGAFLNKAADVLLEIHEAIFNIKYPKKDTLDHVFDSIEQRREILLNNIYGVDLNEESTEITKLSLFLKVCRTGLKLPNLDNNIKTGNSLIDDPQYTNKPFNWKQQFPEIFQTGGFDIVIGNPPYVRQENIKEIKPYLKENYETYFGTSDLYVYFFEKGVKLLKNEGKVGYICSNKFIKANYGMKLRKFILRCTNFDRYVDHTYDEVFEDATAYPSVFVLTKGRTDDNKVLVDDDFELEQNRLNEMAWGFVQPEILDLKDKIISNGIKLGEIEDINIYFGIKTGLNEAFIIDKDTKNRLISEDITSKQVIKPLIIGKNVKRYRLEYEDLFIIFTRRGTDIDEYPAIKRHLYQFIERLTPKNQGQKIGRKPGDYNWFEIQDTVDFFEEFEKPKLIYPEVAPSLFAVFDENKFYTNTKAFIITSESVDLKLLSALLSSKTLNFVFRFLGTPLQGQFFNLSKIFIEQLPIIFSGNKNQQIVEKVNVMLQHNKKFQKESKGFKYWIQKEFDVEKLSKKLEKYYELSEDEFIDELRKKKVDTKSRKNREYLEREFNESLKIIKPLLQEIQETDKEIDRMVYELYGLTEDEIKLIEDSLKN